MFAACVSPAAYPGLGDGLHSFAVRATDLAGNIGDPASASWTVDTQAPNAVIDSAPPAITNSNTAAFTFHTSAGGTLSCQLDAQLATGCSDAVTYPGLGEGSHTFAIRAADAAGNTGIATFSWVVDQTVPALVFGAPSPAPNAAGWNNTNVSIPFTASDPVSGLATVTPPSPLVLSAEGAAVTGAVTATDKAGNSFTATSPAVKIDKAAPTVAFGAPSPVANAAGWNNTNVSIPFTASDALSGIATVGPASPLGLSAEGAAVTATVTATDNAGNSFTATSPAVKIDKTAPTVTLTTPSDGATYAIGDTVNASYSCSDRLSGVASCAAPVASGSAIDLSLGSHTFTVTATDNAGNPATRTVTYSVTSQPTGKQLTALSPAKVWIGLKNSDDVGLRVDLLAEVFLKAGTTEIKVGQGELDNQKTGSSGFNNAILHSIKLDLMGGPVYVPSGAQLELRLSARRTCSDDERGPRSGAVRLWYNGRAIDAGPARDAGTRFGATLDQSDMTEFMRGGAALSTAAGSSRLSVDKSVDRRASCRSRPFMPFGTWSATLP